MWKFKLYYLILQSFEMVSYGFHVGVSFFMMNFFMILGLSSIVMRFFFNKTRIKVKVLCLTKGHNLLKKKTVMPLTAQLFFFQLTQHKDLFTYTFNCTLTCSINPRIRCSTHSCVPLNGGCYSTYR